MIEKNLISQEKLRLVQTARVVTGLSNLTQFGPPDAVLTRLGTEVSLQISAFLSGHPGAMLAQSPQTIADQFTAGKSLMLLTPDGSHVLFHGTMYPIFSAAVSQKLGLQICELGSCITNPEFEGLGLANRGCLEIMQHLKRLNHNTLGIATIKDERMARAFFASRMDVVSFYDVPYIANLTCTCPTCSEKAGFDSCHYRRPPTASTPEIFALLKDRSRPPVTTACTLIVSDVRQAKQMDEYFRSLHSSEFGKSVDRGDVTFASMMLMTDFFAKVTSHAK